MPQAAQDQELHWFHEADEWVPFNPDEMTQRQKDAYVKASFAEQFTGSKDAPIERKLETVWQRMQRESGARTNVPEEETLSDKCPECGSETIVREGRKGGHWVGCSRYPLCQMSFALAI